MSLGGLFVTLLLQSGGNALEADVTATLPPFARLTPDGVVVRTGGEDRPLPESKDHVHAATATRLLRFEAKWIVLARDAVADDETRARLEASASPVVQWRPLSD